MTGRTWNYDHPSPSAVAKGYRNDPYKAPGRVIYYEEESHSYFDDIRPPTPQQLDEPPVGTRHMNLWGRVCFVPYPTEPFYATPPPEDELVRVFIGQLPYFVTDMQLTWLCATFGGGNVVAYPERIMKRQPNGDRLPTGCIHAYASVHAVEAMASGMHKRMLVDDTGVWHAQTAEEFDVLSSYVASMKADRSLRVPNRPYDSVVVQLATSTYIPRHVAAKPELRKTAVSAVADVVTHHHDSGRGGARSGFVPPRHVQPYGGMRGHAAYPRHQAPAQAYPAGYENYGVAASYDYNHHVQQYQF